MAADFGQAMANVNSIMKLPQAALQRLGAQVLELSTKLPQSAKTLADGLYSVASAGYVGQRAMRVLAAAARAASAGMTDTETAAKAIIFALKAYGLGASKARQVSDILFKAVDKGILSFEELAQGMGDWVGAAAQIGVPLSDATAAIAAMTLAGVQAAEASTSLARLFTSLAKPTDALKKALKDMGFASGFAALQALGLQGVIEKLGDRVGKNKQKWFELLGEQRAVRGAFALTANDGKNLNEVMAAMEHRAGATGAAFREQAKGPAFQFKIAINNLQKSLIDLGNTIIPVITRDVIPAIKKGVEWFDNLTDSQKALILKIALVAAALGPASMLMGGLVRLASLPIRAAGAIAKLGTALTGAGRQKDAFGRNLIQISSKGGALGLFMTAVRAAGIAVVGYGLGVAHEGQDGNKKFARSTELNNVALRNMAANLRAGKISLTEYLVVIEAQNKSSRAAGGATTSLKDQIHALSAKTRITTQDFQFLVRAMRGVPPKVRTELIADLKRAFGDVIAYRALLYSMPRSVITRFDIRTPKPGEKNPRAAGGIRTADQGLISRGHPILMPNGILMGEGKYPTFAGQGGEMYTPLDSRGIGIMARAFEMAMTRAGVKGDGSPNLLVQVYLTERGLELPVERILVKTLTKAELAGGD
jgi:TP901 family phage tail tape measure protein